ncbi:HeH/LEM domain-containing protein [Limosilactobacillus ingluviei]|uniref:HeH/LEM domain-containing protein n=1 Tax=Limosilactobacillus ingluviei TaxID=148604 RepID=UPI003D2ECE28
MVASGPSPDVKPTSANTVEEIKAYLDAHQITYPSSALKADLLALVGGDRA